MKVVVAERLQFSEFVLNNHGALEQSWHWGELQEEFDRPAQQLLVLSESGQPLASALLIKHVLRFGFYYWITPRGPVFAKGLERKRLGEVFNTLVEYVEGELGGVFLRVEPELPTDSAFGKITSRLLLAPKDHSPRATRILDLEPDEETLLQQMHHKTRYNIRLAGRKQIRVSEVAREDSDNQEKFIKLLQRTAKRDNFHPHPLDYYRELLRLPQVKLFTAWQDKELVAGAIISLFGRRATYLHGASSYRHRKLMAPYALHWQIIRSVKQAGLSEYDFGGVAPESEAKTHAWRGISRFKKGFGGEYVEYPGTFDLAFQIFWYELYKLARTMAL